jgi:hypothetical protein
LSPVDPSLPGSDGLEPGAVSASGRPGLGAAHPSAGTRLVLSYTVYDAALGGSNLYIREWDGATWSDAIRVSNKLGEVSSSAGLAVDSSDVLHAVWGDERYDDAYFGNAELVAARSEVNGADSWMMRFDEATTFHAAARGDAITFDYTVGNHTGADDTVDVWVEYEGFNGMTGLMQLASNAFVAAGTTQTFTYVGNVHPATPYGDWEVIAFVGDRGVYETATDIFEVEVAP